MNGCDSCSYFVRIKSMVSGVGICDYEDGRLNKVIKRCVNHKPKKYKRVLLKESRRQEG
jgi:hypothetical protein